MADCRWWKDKCQVNHYKITTPQNNDPQLNQQEI